MNMIYRFGELFNIIDGDRGKNYPKDDDFYDDEYCLFLNAGNVTKEGWSFENNSFITVEKDNQLRNGRVERGNTVLTTRGTVGNAAYYGDRVKYEHMRINSGMVILKPKDATIVEDEFIYYLVTSPLAKRTIELFCSGSAQPQLPIKDFIKIKYDLPDLDKQKEVVKILSTYDNLIELNTKRIKTLEQMAENLYKEWFVRFRFPGHENAEFENGIPKGWEIKRIGEIGKVVGGGTPSTEQSEYWNGDIPWLTPADMKSFDDIYISSGSTFITEEGLKKSSATMLPKDTVLLSSRAPIGYVGIAKNPICTNQGFKNVICNPTNILPEVLFYYFKKNKDLLECYASGSTFLEVSSGRLKKIKLIVPPLNIQQIFVDTISPWIKQTDALSEINNNLIKQRDLLLPRLMSGKLEV